jgi:hypothetical protein
LHHKWGTWQPYLQMQTWPPQQPYCQADWATEYMVLMWQINEHWEQPGGKPWKRPSHMQPDRGQIVRTAVVHPAMPPSHSPHKHCLSCSLAVNCRDHAMIAC